MTSIRETIKLELKEYFITQKIVKDEEELNSLMCLLQEPLPATFRLNANSEDVALMKKELNGTFQFKAVCDEKFNKVITPPHALEWYPDEFGGWQMDCGRKALSRGAKSIEVVKKLHEFLKLRTDSGDVSRQEAVSMLPPILLNPMPHHKVLDMCASPGSKSAQLVEMISGGEKEPTGFVVANDADIKRAYMLVHQLLRVGMDHTIVTNHMGQDFPGLWMENTLHKCQVFDRVLCDVPCSGDGTLRKNPELWKSWHIGNSLTLHDIQVQIASRAAALLKINAIMVYSTCSMNPVENEAVVAELLRKADGSLELVDCSDTLPKFIRRPGLNDWQVGWSSKSKRARESITWYTEYDQVPKDLRSGGRILKSMFPTGSKQTPLDACFRILPLDQNTGGFFVAVLKKTKTIPGIQECGLPAHTISRVPEDPTYKCKVCESSEHYLNQCPKRPKCEPKPVDHSKPEYAPPRSKGGKGTKIEHDTYEPLSTEFYDQIIEYYGIQDKSLQGRLYTRKTGTAYVTLVHTNIIDHCLVDHTINMVNTGLRVFSRVSTGSIGQHFRPSQDGLETIVPLFTKRKLEINATDMQLLISNHIANPSGCMVSTLTEETQNLLKDMTMGPAVVLLQKSTSFFAYSVWIGKSSVATLTSTLDLQVLQRRFNATPFSS